MHCFAYNISVAVMIDLQNPEINTNEYKIFFSEKPKSAGQSFRH